MRTTKMVVVISLVAILFSSFSFAREQIDLTTPVVISSYKIVELHLNLRDETIRIVLFNEVSNKDLIVAYEGAVAMTLMNQLNKANFSTNSLQKVILNRLITDGKLTGTISGTPD